MLSDSHNQKEHYRQSLNYPKKEDEQKKLVCIIKNDHQLNISNTGSQAIVSLVLLRGVSFRLYQSDNLDLHSFDS